MMRIRPTSSGGETSDDRPPAVVRQLSGGRAEDARAVPGEEPVFSPRGVGRAPPQRAGGGVGGPGRQDPLVLATGGRDRTVLGGAGEARREAGRPCRAAPAELSPVRDRVLRNGSHGRGDRGQQPAVHVTRAGAPAERLRRGGRGGAGLAVAEPEGNRGALQAP